MKKLFLALLTLASVGAQPVAPQANPALLISRRSLQLYAYQNEIYSGLLSELGSPDGAAFFRGKQDAFEQLLRTLDGLSE